MKNLEKSLTMPEKTERVDPLVFFNNYSVANLRKKIEGGPSEENFSRKKSQCRKN